MLSVIVHIVQISTKDTNGFICEHAKSENVICIREMGNFTSSLIKTHMSRKFTCGY